MSVYRTLEILLKRTTQNTKPFGEYQGRQQIQSFWSTRALRASLMFIPISQVVDGQSTVLTSQWTLNNAQGVIARELWVLQDDGSMRLREYYFGATEPNSK